MNALRPRLDVAGEDALAATLRDKYRDVLLPGYQVAFDPDEAELAGALIEAALRERDALDRGIDASAAFTGRTVSREAQ